jgi:hypothetical protein
VDDARKLAQFYMPGIDISDLLLAEVARIGDYRARRISKTIADMKRWARNTGCDAIPDDWQGEIYSGRPPQRQRRT